MSFLIKKSKILLVITIMLAIVMFATPVFAAVQSWSAVRPTYTVTINDEEIDGNTVMNIDGRTMIRASDLQRFGVENTWANNIASFNVPEAGNTTTVNTTNAFDYAKIAKNQVKFYAIVNGKSEFVGNGVVLPNKKLITSRYVWNYNTTGTLRAIDHAGYTVTYENTPLKTGPRLVLLQTNGYNAANHATIATTAPQNGDNIALVGSIAQVSNYMNFSTVKDTFDYNWMTTGDKAYLRTYNDCHITSTGSGMYNAEGKLVGIFLCKGPITGYALSITLADIRAFLEI